MIKQAVFAFYFFIYPALASRQEDFIIKSLRSAERLELQKELRHGDFLMLFQPDCSSCKAQITQLSCLNRPIKLLGTYGSEERLQLEYKKFKTKFPGFFIEDKILKIINPQLSSVTPQFFVVDRTKQQSIVLKNLGYGLTNCVDLKTKIDRSLDKKA